MTINAFMSDSTKSEMIVFVGLMGLSRSRLITLHKSLMSIYPAWNSFEEVNSPGNAYVTWSVAIDAEDYRVNFQTDETQTINHITAYIR